MNNPYFGGKSFEGAINGKYCPESNANSDILRKSETRKKLSYETYFRIKAQQKPGKRLTRFYIRNP